jgi:hypothetical protein
MPFSVCGDVQAHGVLTDLELDFRSLFWLGGLRLQAEKTTL